MSFSDSKTQNPGIWISDHIINGQSGGGSNFLPHQDLIQSTHKAYFPTSLDTMSTPEKDISKLFLSFEKSGSHRRYAIVTDLDAG